MDSKRVAKQRGTMGKKLAETMTQTTILRPKLQDKVKEAARSSKRFQSNKNDGKCAVDSTKAHLQGQLRHKESENNRLAVQIKNLKHTVEQQKAEISGLKEQLRRSRDQDSEPENLKRAAEDYRRRAERSEDIAAHVRGQLLDMENKFAEALTAAETWQHRHAKLQKDNGQLQAQFCHLKRRVTEMTEKLNGVVAKVRTQARAAAAATTDQSETAQRLRHELQKSQFRERAQEGRGDQLTRTLADLRTKLQDQGAQVELLVTRNKMHVEENRQLHQQLEILSQQIMRNGLENGDDLSWSQSIGFF